MFSFASLRARFSKLSKQQKLVLIGCIAGTGFLVLLLSLIFHERIIDWAKPLAERYTRRRGGFLVPSILLIIVSIPPFFGHELISFLTGFVYGNVGVIIVIISTTIGESILFLSFRHLFTSKMTEFRDKYKDYDIFVRVIEEGGPYMIFAIRCSAIPSHFSTPLLASIAAIEFKTWLICCLVSCWTEYPPVYFGWLLKRGESSKATSWLLAIGAIITISVGLYIYIQYRHHKAVHEADMADLESSLLEEHTLAPSATFDMDIEDGVSDTSDSTEVFVDPSGKSSTPRRSGDAGRQ